MIRVREEDEADRWLRKHDPYYLEKGRDKMGRYSYPYETPKQEKRRCEMEIPLSSLSLSQMGEIEGEIIDKGYGEFAIEM